MAGLKEGKIGWGDSLVVRRKSQKRIDEESLRHKRLLKEDISEVGRNPLDEDDDEVMDLHNRVRKGEYDD